MASQILAKRFDCSSIIHRTDVFHVWMGSHRYENHAIVIYLRFLLMFINIYLDVLEIRVKLVIKSLRNFCMNLQIFTW